VIDSLTRLFGDKVHNSHAHRTTTTNNDKEDKKKDEPNKKKVL